MVSEDSQSLGWFAVIHRLLDFRDLDDSIDRHMSAELHQLGDPYELLEVSSLRSSQWILEEERHDLRAEILEPIDVEPEEILLVVVTSPVDIDLPASEEPL